MDVQFYNSSGFKFSLEREGASVRAHIEALPTPYQDISGLDVWKGSLRSKLGTAGDLDQGKEYEEFWLVNDCSAGLSPGVASAGFFVYENAFKSPRHEKYLVSIFDNATDFTGTSYRDLVFGSEFDDTFKSTVGGDVYEGGRGNDLYLIHHYGTNVVEAVGGGDDDRVATSISFTLSAGAEVEEIRTTMASAMTALMLVGNEFAQTIIANAGNNILDGKGGADVMIGGAGDDIYYVDNAGDSIVEQGGGGQDRVAVVDTSFVLAAGASVEMLTTDDSKGKLALALTGNEYSQTIVGNAGDNVLDGKGGTDTLVGGLGNDTYYVDSSDDVVTDIQGNADIVVARGVDYALGDGARVETLRTSANSGTNDVGLTGNKFAQTIMGNAGDNVIAGRGGNDVLTGFGGSDSFLFDAALSGSGNVDRITDFSVADDQIQLDDAVFSALWLGPLAASAFRTNASTAIDADDRIIYNSSTGGLFYDEDGVGGVAAVKFAVLATGLNLSAADFLVI